MANADKPMGFRVAYTKHGSPARVRNYQSSGTAVIYQGDAIGISGTAGHIKSIAATSDTMPMGVAAEYKAATTGDIRVYDDLTNTIFIAQADTSQIAGTTKVNQFYDLVVGASTATELSIHELDASASTHDTLLLIDKVDRPDNAWGQWVDCYVQFVIDANAISSAITGS